MELFDAVLNRRSCRRFLARPIREEGISRILAAAESCRKRLSERSGWKWIDRYSLEFLKEVPVLIAVSGIPEKSGADLFLEEGAGLGYQHACAAAIQNMLLAAHDLGLGTLWFSLFEKKDLREILGIGADRDPIALVCLGVPSGPLMKTPRKSPGEKTRYL